MQSTPSGSPAAEFSVVGTEIPTEKMLTGLDRLELFQSSEP